MEDIVTFQGNIDELTGRDVYGSDGHKIGSVGQVFVMEGTQEPTWVTVQTGLFGTHESFVPVAEATQRDGELLVPYEKGFVKDAPRIDDASELTVDQEAELYRYYGVQPPMRQHSGHADAGDDHRADARDGARTGHDDHARGMGDGDRDDHGDSRHTDHGDDHDRSHDQHGGATAAGVGGGAAGTPRLRRRVVTEMQTVQVPVQREEIVVEGEGIDASRHDDERR